MSQEDLLNNDMEDVQPEQTNVIALNDTDIQHAMVNNPPRNDTHATNETLWRNHDTSPIHSDHRSHQSESAAPTSVNMSKDELLYRLEAKALAAMEFIEEEMHAAQKRRLAKKPSSSKAHEKGKRRRIRFETDGERQDGLRAAKLKKRYSDDESDSESSENDWSEYSDDEDEESYNEDEDDQSGDSKSSNASEASGSSDESQTSAEVETAYYSLTKYKISDKRELRAYGKEELLEHYRELLRFFKANQDKLSKKNIYDCVVQLEDYLYDTKKAAGKKITNAERTAAEDYESDTDDDHKYKKVKNAQVKALRAVVKANTMTLPSDAPAPGYGAILKQIGSSIINKITGGRAGTLTLVGEDAPTSQRYDFRDHLDSKSSHHAWIINNIAGKHPSINPEVQTVLEKLKLQSKKQFEENEKYTKDIYYHPDDLKFITIDTLPTNGDTKPAHGGPQDSDYFQFYFDRLIRSCKTWVARYFEPMNDISIPINDPLQFPPTLLRTIKNIEYFEEDDFVLSRNSPKEKESEATRKTKRILLMQYCLFSIIFEEIWKRWLYGFSTADEHAIKKSLGVNSANFEDYFPQNTHKRAKFFLENVRRTGTTVNEAIIIHQICIVAKIRDLFLPLLRFSKMGKHLPIDNKRLPVTAERELHMIISDAQALQVMLQSEFRPYKIFLNTQGQKWNPSIMVNAADPNNIWGGETVPGPIDIVKESNSFISLPTEPGFWLAGEILHWERVVLQKRGPKVL